MFQIKPAVHEECQKGRYTTNPALSKVLRANQVDKIQQQVSPGKFHSWRKGRPLMPASHTSVYMEIYAHRWKRKSWVACRLKLSSTLVYGTRTTYRAAIRNSATSQPSQQHPSNLHEMARPILTIKAPDHRRLNFNQTRQRYKLEQREM